MMRPRPTRLVTSATVVLIALTMAGCGGDDPPAVCSAVDSLKTSVDDVTKVDLGKGALAEIQDNISKVQSDLTQVKDDAKDEYASEVGAVEKASASVSSTVKAAIATPSAQAITDVGAAVQALGTSLTDLESAVKSTC